MPDVAYISKGKLFVRAGGAAPDEVQSRFVEDVRRRASSTARRNAWKTQGRGARFMFGLGGATDPEELFPEQVVHARMTGLSRGPAGQILYSLTTGAVNGLFAWSLAEREERRLFHAADLPIEQICLHPEDETVACVLRGKGGISHLALMRPEGKGLREITEGDTIDAAPAWVPGRKNQLVYHSAGIGRDAAGQFAELGPAAVYRLDLERGDVVCLVEEPDHDLTAPRVASDGTLYYLRRPRPRLALSPWRLLLDAVLLPFRLVRAFAGYLNVFSVRYSGKPLLTAGTARKRQADMRRMLVAGNLMSAASDADGPAEVDASWQLMRKVGDTPAECVAKSVLCFDVANEGVVYSSGGVLHHLASDGTTEALAKGSWIESVVVL